MATVAGPQTPQRPLPGAFMNTPQQPPPQGSTIFYNNAATLRQNMQQSVVEAQNTAAAAAHTTAPVERAARTINETLASEERFPELESYVLQGTSGGYELPTGPAWLPFQKLKMHDLPPRLLEQANHAGMGMQMGIFPALAHAWVALDNCLYLWDYSITNPEIVGFEESTQPITAVKLVAPKPGVFIEDIKHMIVICTSDTMTLLGVATQSTSTGAPTIALYNTKMSIPIRGINVSLIEYSRNTGRIFFCGSITDDIYEFHYQQDEGWFSGRCNRLCHTRTSSNFVAEKITSFGDMFTSSGPKNSWRQLVIDDTRNLMYTLSTTSEIKVWLIKDRIEGGLLRPMQSLLQNTGHFNSRMELLVGREVSLASISVVTAVEASKIGLVATTSTGCRLYLSLTRGYGNQADAQNPPSSMQVLHIRFPPSNPNAPPPQPQQGQTALTTYNQNPSSGQGDSQSRYLTPTTMSYRFAPGYWMAFQPHPNDPSKDRVFCAAPDSARLKNPQDPHQLKDRYGEYGQWIDLPANVQQVMSMTDTFGATNAPAGFGNELAVQYDVKSSEFAIVTSAGIQTFRRRRLVDIFASMLKYGSSDDEGNEGDIKRFVRTYGRGETAATALAVACGQGMDVADSRIANVTDPDVIEKARRAFIEHGGKADYSANDVVDQGQAPIDSVRPSPRHEGMALYISRLVRSIWRATIIKEVLVPGAGAKLEPTIALTKLRSIQRDLTSLNEFLERNRSFIEGLAGPDALSRVNSRQEEIALQGEHRAMNSLLQLISSISEGISFVLVLFDERIEEILALLPDQSKQDARQLTFERLFVSPIGRELAKDLVKAIVNRNIANGSNVDSVAEALRRRCGSFCSADDVVIFKAQEQVKRGSEAGSTDAGRQLLNESHRLFKKVAGSLSYEHLKWAVERYVEMSFYAGAISLCLDVAAEKDKSRRAHAWLRDGKPEGDERKADFDAREQCYKLVFMTIVHLDASTANSPETVDGRHTLAGKRRSEAYDIVNCSDDTVFLTCLYDWYVGELAQPDRLLEINNPFVVEYLRKRSQDSRGHADLLWRYFAHQNDYLQSASVQLDIARSHFDISLEERIGYLSRARTNASTRQTALTDARQSKQKLLREVSDLLDIAQIQDEILSRIRADTRFTNETRPALVQELDSQILSVEILFNKYADGGGYHDLCILLYMVADHRNAADIKASWEQLITATDAEAPALHGRQRAPWEAVGEKVREMGRRLQTAPSTFPIPMLLPLLEKYADSCGSVNRPGDSWAVDVFLDLEIPHETILPILEMIYFGNEYPFEGQKRGLIAGKMVYLIDSWLKASERNGDRIPFGSEENLHMVTDCLATLVRSDHLDNYRKQQADILAASIHYARR
ncbi:unnamed protein product [Zymoseptoria tritici ST99CH_1E4]|uniref:Nucleoporin Nup133/Nup155-like N-terminal domain-containing protein n=1 Tax=Zymoseptoria tritici ST99CH_1E4 TaxID=1276532 RepID=A0A2H1GHS3_ZYMTR|nr:unnamed protein product [Zymoseptoria tritici ST99CH_1E4]